MIVERFNAIARSRTFINLTTTIIIAYAIVLGIRTFEDVVIPYAGWFEFLDHLVTVYFLAEICIKLFSEKRMLNFFKDSWNVFDFIIVTVSLLPIDHNEFALIARVLRVFRVLRLITTRPQLKELINVLIRVIPSIIDIVILLFIIFYIYAIIGSFLFQTLPSGLWKNFGIAMLTLFRVLTFEDWTDVMYEAMELYSWSWIYFVSFVIIAAFVFFNLFIAVIIGEMEGLRQQKMEAMADKEEQLLQSVLQRLERIEHTLHQSRQEEHNLRKRNEAGNGDNVSDKVGDNASKDLLN